MKTDLKKNLNENQTKLEHQSAASVFIDEIGA